MKILTIRVLVATVLFSGLVIVTPLPVSSHSAVIHSEAAINPELLANRWTARWIYPAGAAPTAFGVYHYRKEFSLAARPERFVVHVTADNRYRLFVNGRQAAWGPARGDLHHWRYETVDIAHLLRPGPNLLAAVVWNYAEYAPEAQVTNRTAFLLQGDMAAERIVDTDESWKCIRNDAYSPIHFSHTQMRGYFVAGPGEEVDGRRYPWDWEQPDFDDSGWPNAVTDGRSYGSPRMIRDAGNRWMLVPRSIPPMSEVDRRFGSVKQTTGVTVPDGFPGDPVPLTVPAHTNARLLLDQGHLMTGYPELVIGGGRGARVSIGYAEALYNPGARGGDKGNRNEVEGKEFVGYYDLFRPDGGESRSFRPLWWRTWRYVELKIVTADESLVLEDLYSVSVGYPFERKATFQSELPFIDRLLEIGWRTARLCAHETYMDCPYYEQLQYAGDTRIQALISYFNAGDGRLARNAIAQLDHSRIPDGITMSRAPTRQQQFIPPFSLWWIGMVHDYWMYRDDPDFVRTCLPGVRAVLEFFSQRQKPDGLLGRIPWWRFVDWVPEWPSGESPTGPDGSSASLDLQLLLAYQWADELEEALGSPARADENREAAERLAGAVLRRYWDDSRELFADTSDRKFFSQHTNALAVLAGVIRGAEARNLVLRILDDPSLARCSYYFRYYLYSAVAAVGEGDRYLSLLDDWQSMLDAGLTTWAERPEYPADPARSDCHAWSAHPNIEVFRTLLGIDTAAPGFKRVVIRPHPGDLTRLSGSIPHPQGTVSVRLEVDGSRLRAEVELPVGVEGSFEWKGQSRALSPGRSSVRF